MEQRERATDGVAAGILACRRAGLPSPVEKTSRTTEHFVNSKRLSQSMPIPGGKDARPPYQARMPDATTYKCARADASKLG